MLYYTSMRTNQKSWFAKSSDNLIKGNNGGSSWILTGWTIGIEKMKHALFCVTKCFWIHFLVTLPKDHVSYCPHFTSIIVSHPYTFQSFFSKTTGLKYHQKWQECSLCDHLQSFFLIFVYYYYYYWNSR